MKRIQLGSAFTFCLLFVVSCALDQSPTVPKAGDPLPDKLSRGETGICYTPLHDECEEYLDNGTGVIFEMMGGFYDCSDTVIIDATPGSWGPGHEVSLVIPKGAVPTDYPGYPIINFRVGVPVVGPEGGRSSVPYQFFPDGIEFQLPISVRLSWPDWAVGDSVSVSNLSIVNLKTEFHDGEVHYRIFRYVTQSEASKALPSKTGDFFIEHFSRWEIVNGDKDGVIDPGLIFSGEVYDGEPCWTPLDIDPGISPLIR